MKCAYKSGYKFQLVKTFYIQTSIYPEKRIETDYITLTESGYLTIRNSYAWDGASGAADTKSIIVGSLVHDVGYQLIRLELLSMDYRKVADKELYRLCVERGMPRVRAGWVYQAVRLFGKKAALPENKKEVLVA